MKRKHKLVVTGVLLCLLLSLTAVTAGAVPADEQAPLAQPLAAAGDGAMEEVPAIPVALLAVVGTLALGCVGMAVYKAASES